VGVVDGIRSYEKSERKNRKRPAHTARGIKATEKMRVYMQVFVSSQEI